MLSSGSDQGSLQQREARSEFDHVALWGLVVHVGDSRRTSMAKMMLAVMAAAFVLVVSAPAQSSDPKLAQTDEAPGVQVAPGVRVNPGGVTIGEERRGREERRDQREREGCRTVTTTVETADGEKRTKSERRCDGE
jgi:hypothetical protein